MRLRALFAWLLLASLPALAEEAAAPGRGFDELFRRMDRDGDGKLTREEMKAPRLFEAMDANRDGFVTLEEARAHFANQAEGEDAQEPAGQEAPAWVTPAARGPRLQQRIFDSAAAKSKVSFHVYVPEAHDAERDRRFPVLYWLHGSGGGLSGVPQLAERFDSAIRAGKVPPMLVVFPNGLADGMWCDSRDGKTPVETVILKELVPLVDASFRTVASREGRIVEGFSMGGWGGAVRTRAPRAVRGRLHAGLPPRVPRAPGEPEDSALVDGRARRRPRPRATARRPGRRVPDVPPGGARGPCAGRSRSIAGERGGT
jgi:hypothetical protein